MISFFNEMNKVVYSSFRWQSIEQSAAICDNTRQIYVYMKEEIVSQKPRFVNKHTLVSKLTSISGISD